MTDPTTTTYERVARDANGDPLRVGGHAVIHRDGRYVLGAIVAITNHTGLGDIVTLETHTGERISACADVCVRSRRELKRRAAA